MRKRIFRLLYIAAIGILLSQLKPISKAQAQGAISPTIGVSPGLVRQTVKPGDSQTVNINLTNYGQDPIPLGLDKLDVVKINDNGSPELTTNFGPRSAADWVNSDKSDVIIAPGEKSQLTITINPPKDLAPGGYTAVLVFQAKLPSYYFDIDAGARVLPAVSTSFLISVTGGEAPGLDQLKISSFKTPKLVISSPIPVVTELTNPTNFFYFANGEITIEPAFGNKKEVSSLSNSVVLPESSRQYVAAYAKSILPGVYTARAQIGQGDKVLVASSRFVAIPWPFLVGLSLAIVLTFGLLAKRRLRHAWKVLLTGQSPESKRSRTIIR